MARRLPLLISTLSCALLLGFGPFSRGDDAASAQLQDARAQVEAGEIDEAIGTLRALRLKYQDSPAGYEGTALLGALLLEQGDAEGALTAAQGVLRAEDAPADATGAAHLVAGLSLHRLQRFAEARSHLEPLDGRVTSPTDARHLSLAMVDIAAAEADSFAEVQWLVRAMAFLPASEQIAARVRAEELILEQLTPSQLAPLATRYGQAYPGDIVMLAQIKASFRAGDMPATVSLCERFERSWPDHPQKSSVQLYQQRAAQSHEFEPTRIGVILPLTGRFSAPGLAVQKGMRLALAQQAQPGWSKRQIELIFRDTAGEEDTATAAVKELVLEQHVAAIIGPLTSHEAMGPALLAQELEVPLITLTQRQGVPEVGGYIFRNFPTTERQLLALATYAKENMGVERLGILYPENRYGTYNAEVMWDEAQSLGIEISAVEPYQTGGDDYTPVAMKLAGKFYMDPRRDEANQLRWKMKNDSNPSNDSEAIELPAIVDFDALFVADSYRTAALLAPALAYVEIPIGRFTVDKRKPIQLIGGNTWNNPELARIGGDYVIGATFVTDFFAGATAAATQTFVSGYKKANGSAPETFAAHGYDSVAVLMHVIGQSEPTSRAEVRDRLDQIEAFQGATGTFSFSPDGDLERDPYILSINRRKVIVQVYPVSEPAPTTQTGQR